MIKLFQAKLDLCISNTVAVPVNVKKFPEEEMPINQLVEHLYIIILYPVRCTVEKPSSSWDYSRKDVTQHRGRCHINHKDPVITYAKTAGGKCNRYPVDAHGAKYRIYWY